MGRLDGWRFCPRCTAPLAAAPGRVDCAACGFVAWANAAPTASALLEDRQGRLHTLNLYWRVRVTGEQGEPVPADDVAELAWFHRDALPPRQELASDCVPRALAPWKALSPG